MTPAPPSSPVSGSPGLVARVSLSGPWLSCGPPKLAAAPSPVGTRRCEMAIRRQWDAANPLLRRLPGLAADKPRWIGAGSAFSNRNSSVTVLVRGTLVQRGDHLFPSGLAGGRHHGDRSLRRSTSTVVPCSVFRGHLKGGSFAVAAGRDWQQVPSHSLQIILEFSPGDIPQS